MLLSKDIKDFKIIELKIDIHFPSLSKIIIDGKEVTNITSIKIEASVNNPTALIEMEAIGGELAIERDWTLLVKPNSK